VVEKAARTKRGCGCEGGDAESRRPRTGAAMDGVNQTADSRQQTAEASGRVQRLRGRWRKPGTAAKGDCGPSQAQQRNSATAQRLIE